MAQVFPLEAGTVHISDVNTLWKDENQFTTGVGTGGAGGPGPPLGKRGASTLFSHPTFHGSPLCLALSISIYQLPYLRQHCLGLSICPRSLQGFENGKFSTPCEGKNPSHTLPNSVAPLPRMCDSPLHF